MNEEKSIMETVEYMTKAEYASEHVGVVKNAEEAGFAGVSNDSYKLGAKPAADYAQVSTVNSLIELVGTAQNTANSARDTADAAKAGLAGKIDKEIGKGLSSNDYTNDEKAKLSGVEEGANNYVHPDTHSVSMITGLPEVEQAVGDSPENVMSQKAVTDALAEKGDGDMKKSVYDTNGNGSVDNADKLGEKKESELSVANAAKLGNITAVDTMQFKKSYNDDAVPWNSITETGIYRVNNVTNIPLAGVLPYGELVVKQTKYRYIQEYTDLKGQKIVRGGEGKPIIWQSWRYIFSTTSENVALSHANNLLASGAYLVVNGTVANGYPYPWGTLQTFNCGSFISQLFLGTGAVAYCRGWNIDSKTWSEWKQL